MRATLITTGSVLLTTSVIGNAFYNKKQFYPSVVYITKSNPSMAVSTINDSVTQNDDGAANSCPEIIWQQLIFYLPFDRLTHCRLFTYNVL